MINFKKPISWLFSASMVISSLTVPSVYAEEPAEPTPQVNLALNRPATATGVYPGMGADKAVDGNLETRWATEESEHAGSNHSITVQLAAPTKITGYKVFFEEPRNNPEGQRVTKYRIEASTDGKTFEVINDPEENAEGYAFEDAQTITNEKKFTHVKLHVESLKPGAYESISVREFEVYGEQDEVIPAPETPVNTNIAAGKTGSASADPDNIAKLTDGNYDKDTSRWSAEAPPTQWFSIDLGKVETFNTFKATWENDEEHAKDYNIYVSNDGENWGEAVVKKTGNDKRVSEDVLEENVQGRYIKVEVTAVSKTQNVSCCEFEVFNKEEVVQQDPSENIALGKQTAENGNEGSGLTSSKLVDGNRTDRTSRWSSRVSDGPHWVRIDLGKTMDVQTVRLYWETRKATNYKIEYTTDATVTESTEWTVFESFTTRPSSTTQTVVKDAPVKARHVRLYIDSFDKVDPDSSVQWNTISLYEIEIFGGQPQQTVDELLNSISVDTPKKGDKKVTVHMPQIPGYELKYNGTDYEQVVGQNLDIYTPVVDTEVTLSFKATNEKNAKENIFKEVKVVIPGEFTVEEGDNAAPKILPELREWKGHTGTFSLSGNARIMIASDALKDMADAFKQDLKDATGKDLQIVTGTNPQAGDFYFNLNAENEGLGKEGYKMTIADAVTVEAEDATGAFWATRTILQALKSSGENTMPKGITRDYPLYSVRGFILDVGRKTFTMDYLTQFMKQMAYYKLNDFHVHLNDNLIPLEHYNPDVDAIMNAYSGFRLESDIKEGGNGGKNKADLTSKDVFYTKDEFRNFIKQSRVYGVNIVPEIDVPAHSLALTKVRPDLRHGTSGRDNDHLNLTTKYEESLAFVKEIFDEYITGPNPVFDEQTTVHFGADEYTANGNAYRRFVNDMKQYLADNDRQARVWGSLTTIKGDGSVPVTGTGVEMNIWNGGWADMGDMYNKGFDLINCVDGQYYIVPNAGYYYDYLNANVMYNTAINQASNDYIPAGDPQMKGGAFAVWNDMCDYLNNGVTEYDVFDRSNESLPLFAAKLWGKDADSMTLAEAQETKAILGNAPGTNFAYEHEADENGIYEHIDAKDIKGTNASVEKVDFKEAIQLNGGESYVNTVLNTTLGLNTSLKFKVKRTSDSVTEDQVLFEGSYGQIIGVMKDSGKFGVRRENYDLVFDYALPVDRWVEVEIVNGATGANNQNFTELYINGQLINRIGDDEKAAENKKMLGTTMIPFERVGSKTNAFVGYIDDIVASQTEPATATPVQSRDTSIFLEYALEDAMYGLEYGKYADEVGKELESLIKEAQALLAEETPDQAKVDELTNRIQEVLEEVEIKSADYSQIDAAIALIPENPEKYFTAQSIANLNAVIGQVRRGLPVYLQATVDAYAKDVVAALRSLVKLAGLSEDSYYTGKMTGTASSYQGPTPPAFALDGNTSTHWHSDWTVTTPPHWFMIELGEAQNIDGLYYLPRQDGSTNGTATKYEVHVGMTSENLVKVAEGSLAQNRDAKVITFDAREAKFIKFVMKQAGNNNGSAAEFKVHVVPTDPDFTNLNALIAQVEGLNRDLYTKETLSVLDEAVKAGKALGQDATYSDVEKAKIQIIDAMVYGLNTITPEVTIPATDWSALELAIKQAEALNRDQYTEESLKALDEAVKAANALDKDATQRAVNEAAKAINKAIAGLVVKPDVDQDKVDFSKLNALLVKARGIREDGYTVESYTVLQETILVANDVVRNENATQEQVDAMVKALQAAIDGLQKLTPGSDPVTPENPTDKPATGDMTNIGFYMAMVGLASVGMFFALRKRKEEIQ